MKHGILTIVAPLKQGTETVVRDRILKLGNGGLATGPLIGLHFASVTVLGGKDAPDDFSPHLLFEASFDGTREDFVADLIAHGGPWLDTIFRDCEGYPTEGHRIPQVVNNYLFDHDCGANCSYIAYPYRSVEQIHHEHGLRLAVAQIERRLRAVWLPPPRPRALVSRIREQIAAIPALRGALTPPERAFITTYGPQIGNWVFRSVIALVFLGAVGFIASVEAERPGKDYDLAVAGALALVLFSVVATLLGVWRPVWRKRSRTALMAAGLVYLASNYEKVRTVIDAIALLVAALSFLLFVAFIVLLAVGLVWLIVVQLHEWLWDPSPAVPYWDAKCEERLRLQEHLDAQNHMVGLNLIKGGLFWGRFRRMTLRLVLWTIHRVKDFQKSGFLSGISTIHFARWVIIDRGRRVLFISHYDGDWDAYLGDFVEQASNGLTAIWSNCVGFPRSWFLFFGGARDQRAFKAYARNSQHETLWVHRAYPQLTVNDIQNHTAIREALGQSLDAEGLDELLQRL
jgi:hypothetical protein